MQTQQLWPWLILTAIMMIGGMVAGVFSSNRTLVVASAGMFAMAASYIGQKFAQPTTEEASSTVSARFARLLAVAYAWSGVAMLACYYLTDLSWQHAWQYGVLMLLVAALVYSYGEQRLLPDSTFSTDRMVVLARWMTALQGLAAMAAIIWLALSGKLQADKQDWAANIVFVAGGLTIASLSASALLAEYRTRQAGE